MCTAVHVQRVLLVGDQPVALFQIGLGRHERGFTWGHHFGIRASSRDDFSVGVEQAAVGVEQVLLVGDKLAAGGDLRCQAGVGGLFLRCGRQRGRHQDKDDGES